MDWEAERERDRTGDTAVALATFVLLWFSAVSVIGAAKFAAGQPLPSWTAELAAALAGGSTCILARRSGVGWRSLATAAVLTAALAVGSAFLALSFLDLGDDSQTYHLSAVIRIARGWVPWRERLGTSGMYYGWCMDSYPRASYLASALVYRLAHRIDMAKLPQMLLAGAAFALTLGAARKLLPRKPVWAGVTATLAAANPITFVQLATNYVDGMLGSALLAMGAGMLLLARNRDNAPLAAACACSAAALACGFKFSGVIFATVLAVGGGAVAAYAAGTRRGRTVLVVAVAGVAAAVLVLEANPYVTNTQRGGNPFWPLVGGGPGPWSPAAGDEPGEMAPSFASHGRMVKLALSVFARADSLPGVSPGIRLKLPFTVYRRELGYFRWVDTRASGFGPLYSGALVLAALALGLAVRRDRRRTIIATASVVLVLISALLMPYAWYARYVPQLWLVPVIALVAAAGSASRSARGVAAALAATLALDAGLVSVAHFTGEVRGTRAHRAQLARLADVSARRGALPVVFGRSESHRVRFEEHGIRFIEEPSLPCRDPVRLLSLTDTRVCVPEPVATVVWPG